MPYAGVYFPGFKIPSSLNLPMMFMVFKDKLAESIVTPDPDNSEYSNRSYLDGTYTNCVKEYIESGDVYCGSD